MKKVTRSKIPVGVTRVRNTATGEIIHIMGKSTTTYVGPKNGPLDPTNRGKK